MVPGFRGHAIPERMVGAAGLDGKGAAARETREGDVDRNGPHYHDDSWASAMAGRRLCCGGDEGASGSHPQPVDGAREMKPADGPLTLPE